jgi:triacylglycerol esterase/lipase EstA (alpha/beta hydrolase family)
MPVRRRAALSALSTLLLASAWSIAPASAATPADPVIIVAGTFSPALANEPLAARLRADGYRVSIFVLPAGGTGDIRDAARALDRFADGVRAAAGAARVDLIGHSQGGLVARTYVKDDGGAGEVDSLITLGAPNRGTSVANLATIVGFGNCLTIVACRQMAIGSSYLNDLNAGTDTIGAVRYTTFRTLQDELVRPVDNATLFDGATNVLVQSRCWLRVVGHVGLILDGAVYSGIHQALEGRPIALDCFAL